MSAPQVGRVAEQPRVDEQHRPADREQDQNAPHHVQDLGVGEQGQADAAIHPRRDRQRDGRDVDHQRDPHRDSSDPPVAHDQLGRPGQHERHQDQRDGPAEPYSGRVGIGTRTYAAADPCVVERHSFLSVGKTRVAQKVKHSCPYSRLRRAVGCAIPLDGSGTFFDMPDRPNSDGSSSDDAYSWLYEGPPRQSSEQQPSAPDSEATQAMPDANVQPADGATQAMGSQGQYPPQQYPQQPAPQDPNALPPPNLPPPGSGDSQEPPRERPPRPPRRKHPIRNIILILVLAWIVFMIAIPIWAWSKIDKVDAEPDGDRPGDQPGTTYLLVGSDSREGLSDEEKQELNTGSDGGQRTDTIMLMHVGSGPTVLMSIPRDSNVEVPGHGTSKVNAA